MGQKPVKVITSADLEENGGVYKLMGGSAIRVRGTSSGGNIDGGALTPVYVVSDADIASGRFKVEGGFIEPVSSEITSRPVSDHIAIPVWAVNSSEWPGGVTPPAFSFFIDDQFTDTVSAGSVSGTSATPGPGTRNVPADTNNTISVGGGDLIINGTASSNYLDPRFHYDESSSRSAGLILLFESTAAVGRNFTIRWINTNSFGRSASFGYNVLFNNINASLGSLDVNIGPLTAATSYVFAVLVRATGYQMLKKISGAWRLDYIFSTTSDPTLYIGGSGVSNLDSTHDFIRGIEQSTFLATPVISDGFTTAFGTTDGKGHLEGVSGGLGSGGGGETWLDQGTWSTSGGNALNTPTVGSELITNGDMESGSPPSSWNAGIGASLAASGDAHAGSQSLEITSTLTFAINATQSVFTANHWYRASSWIKNVDATDGFLGVNGGNEKLGTVAATSYTQVAGTFFATSSNITLGVTSLSVPQSALHDDVTAGELLIEDLVSVVDVAESDVYISTKIVNWNDVTQVGVSLCVDDQDNVQNGIFVYFGQNVSGLKQIFVKKIVSGTYTTVSQTTFLFSASDELVVMKDGSTIRIYYNDVFLKEDTISDVGVISNTLHGLFSTDSANTFSDYVCYPSTGYTELDQYIP